MALAIEDRKPFYTSTESSLRLGIFVAHAVSAAIMLAKAFGAFDESGCKGMIFSTTRMVTADDPYVRALDPVLYNLRMNRVTNVTDCAGDTSWNQGWCKLRNLPVYYDYESDQDSFVFGSSWNIIFAVAVFEWITASYALFYFDPFDEWLPYEALWWGLHPVVVVCSLWNLALILVVWCNQTTHHIPLNNAFLYTMALGATIVIQNFLAINRSWRIDSEKEEPAHIEYSAGAHSAHQLRTDLFLRSRSKNKYKPMYPPKSANYDFHESSYMILFDRCSCSPLPRYLEYFITAPLLLAALYASSVPNDLTWKYQFIIISIMACNAVGVPLHYSVLNISCDVQRFTKSATYFLAASWLCLVTGLYIFVWTIREFLLNSDSGMPQWVQMLVWIMLVMYSLFGVAASRYYLPRIMWETPYGAEDYRWLSFYFDILSLAVKLPVAWTIWMKGAVLMCEKAVTC